MYSELLHYPHHSSTHKNAGAHLAHTLNISSWTGDVSHFYCCRRNSPLADFDLPTETLDKVILIVICCSVI